LLSQLFLKELFPLFPTQLKMPLFEDFQFSHEGVPPSWSFAAPEKVHPLSLSKTKSTQKKLRYRLVAQFRGED
jgi:hypothetical protein